jgi:hypothetical protein
MSDASSLEAIRQSKEYQAARKQLADREWRLDNLYWIKSEDGVPIPFRRNEAQLYYSGREWFRDTILKSRKIGFSTFIAIEMLDKCMFASNAVGGIIDRTMDDAKSKLAIVKFAYERMPQSMREANPLSVDNQEELKWQNGSKIVAGTSYRGDTPQMLWVSEFGPISAKSPQVAKEIKTGSITSVPKNGKVWVESTPMGTSGEFFELVKGGEQLEASGQALTQLDFKLHFFGWHQKKENRLPINLVHIPADMREYFHMLEVKHGIKTDGQQQAWYVKERERLGPDDMKSEHPSTPDECFYASLEGAYFKEEMNQARRDKRIGQPVPYDKTRPVHTYWDLGMDGNMAIGFFQSDGVRHRHIDFARGDNSGLSDGIRILKEKNQTRGFVYGKHYGPHDLETRDWSNMTGVTAQTRKEVAADHGIDFIVVDRVGDKADSIEAARRFINNSWFCSEYASDLVECLDNYTKGWNKTTSQWMATPAKNGFDHGADAYQQAAMGLQPDVVHRRDQLSGNKRKGSHWSS